MQLRCGQKALMCGVDLLVLCVAAVVLAAGFPQPAFAYVDPSVMTYTIQALAGVAVALSTLLGVAYRRVRKRLVATLGIDENAGKVVEPDVHAVGDTAEMPQVDAGAAAFWQAAPQPGAARRLGWKSRFWRGILAGVALALALVVVPSFELLVANASSLTFGLADVWAPAVGMALAIVVAVACVLTLLRGRAFDIAFSLVAALAVLLWLQPMFLNVGLPAADGNSVPWSSYVGIASVSAAVWAVGVAGAVMAAVLVTKRCRQCLVVVAAALVVMQGAGVGAILVQASQADPSTDFVMTQQGMLDVAPDNNVIVLVLDMYDTADFRMYLHTHSEVANELTGFTWYADSAGSLIPTRFGIPYLLTGVMPADDQDYSQFVAGRYQNSTLLDDIYAQGYDIGVYTDTMTYPETYACKVPYISNIQPQSQVDMDVDVPATCQVLLQASLYRNLPWVVKPAFWYTTDQVNQAMAGSSRALTGQVDYQNLPYVIDDSTFHSLLDAQRVSVVDRGATGAFRFIHLEGAHFPYTLDENGWRAAGETSRTDQAAGAMRIALDYLDQLKELGVYDTSTIIITADHGLWESNPDTATFASSPVLLVKPATNADGTVRYGNRSAGAIGADAAGAAGVADAADATGVASAGATATTVTTSAQPLVTNRLSPTGHVDYPATVIKAVGGDWQKYGTAVDEVPGGISRDRVYYFLAHNYYTGTDVELQQFIIHGTATSFSTWERTGDVLANDGTFHK